MQQGALTLEPSLLEAVRQPWTLSSPFAHVLVTLATLKERFSSWWLSKPVQTILKHGARPLNMWCVFQVIVCNSSVRESTNIPFIANICYSKTLRVAWEKKNSRDRPSTRKTMETVSFPHLGLFPGSTISPQVAPPPNCFLYFWNINLYSRSPIFNLNICIRVPMLEVSDRRGKRPHQQFSAQYI